MDAVVRSRRLVLIATVAALACACIGRGSRGAVGLSDRPRGGAVAREAGDGGARDGLAALPREYRARFTKVNPAPFVSVGHASGRWEVEVYANEVAAKALASRSRAVPVGAIVVEEHTERASGAKGPVMAMEKGAPGTAPEHGDWRWVVVGSRDQLVAEGVVESCAGCHDDAPMDGLFPVVP